MQVEAETFAALCAVETHEPIVYGTTWTSGVDRARDADDR